MSQETFENLCNPNTFMHVIDMLAYCERQGNVRGIRVFADMRERAIRECGIIIRNLDKRMYNAYTKEKKMTYRGFDKFEVDEEGKLHVPDPRKEDVKVKRVLSDSEITLMNTEREAQKPTKSFEAQRRWL